MIMTLLELGYTPRDSLTTQWKIGVYEDKMLHIQDDDPLEKALKLCASINTKCYRAVVYARDLLVNPFQSDNVFSTGGTSLHSDGSGWNYIGGYKFLQTPIFHIQINPECCVHPLYTTPNCVPEHYRTCTIYKTPYISI